MPTLDQLKAMGLISDEAMQKTQDPSSFLNPIPGTPPMAGVGKFQNIGKSPGKTINDIDAKAEKLLKGTDFHPMDLGNPNLIDQLPPKAQQLATQRQSALTELKARTNEVDQHLSRALQGSGYEPMDLALNPDRVQEISPEAQQLWQHREWLNGN